MTQFTLTIFPEGLTAPGSRHSLSLEDFRSYITTHSVAHKKDVRGWSPIVWADDRRKAALAESVCALVYDLDTPHDIVALTRTLDAFGHEAWLSETWTPGRGRLVIPLATPLTPAEHKAAWEHTADILGIHPDSQCSDLARGYYAPMHPQGESRDTRTWKGELYSPPRLTKASPHYPVATTENLKNFSLDSLKEAVQAIGRRQHRLWAEALLEGKNNFKEGSRNASLNELMSRMAYLPNPPPEEIMALLLKPFCASMPGPQDEDWYAVGMSQYKRALERRAQALVLDTAVMDTLDIRAQESPWMEQLVRGEMGLKLWQENISLILQNDPEFIGKLRKNLMTMSVTKDYAETLDTAVTKIRRFVEKKYQASFSTALIISAIAETAELNAFNPVTDYLNALQWDGLQRLNSFLVDHLKAESTRPGYLSMVGRKWMIGAVARAFEPGCQMDNTLALTGGEGGGKTTFLRMMGGEFYHSAGGNIEDKDGVMANRCGWIIEFAEMTSMSKADGEKIKSFLTTGVDRYRPPYGRDIMEFPRVCVFAITTNISNMLKETGINRRFWPVKVGLTIFDQLNREKLALSRDQLWAEAVHAYKAGETWHMSPEDTQAVIEETAAFQEGDPTSDAFENWYNDKIGVSKIQAIQIVMEALDITKAQVKQWHYSVLRKVMAKYKVASFSYSGATYYAIDKPTGVK